MPTPYEIMDQEFTRERAGLPMDPYSIMDREFRAEKVRKGNSALNQPGLEGFEYTQNQRPAPEPDYVGQGFAGVAKGVGARIPIVKAFVPPAPIDLDPSGENWKSQMAGGLVGSIAGAVTGSRFGGLPGMVAEVMADQTSDQLYQERVKRAQATGDDNVPMDLRGDIARGTGFAKSGEDDTALARAMRFGAIPLAGASALFGGKLGAAGASFAKQLGFDLASGAVETGVQTIGQGGGIEDIPQNLVASGLAATLGNVGAKGLERIAPRPPVSLDEAMAQPEIDPNAPVALGEGRREVQAVAKPGARFQPKQSPEAVAPTTTTEKPEFKQIRDKKTGKKKWVKVTAKAAPATPTPDPFGPFAEKPRFSAPEQPFVGPPGTIRRTPGVSKPLGGGVSIRDLPPEPRAGLVWDDGEPRLVTDDDVPMLPRYNDPASQRSYLPVNQPPSGEFDSPALLRWLQRHDVDPDVWATDENPFEAIYGTELRSQFLSPKPPPASLPADVLGSIGPGVPPLTRNRQPTEYGPFSHSPELEAAMTALEGVEPRETTPSGGEFALSRGRGPTKYPQGTTSLYQGERFQFPLGAPEDPRLSLAGDIPDRPTLGLPAPGETALERGVRRLPAPDPASMRRAEAAERLRQRSVLPATESEFGNPIVPETERQARARQTMRDYSEGQTTGSGREFEMLPPDVDTFPEPTGGYLPRPGDTEFDRALAEALGNYQANKGGRTVVGPEGIEGIMPPGQGDTIPSPSDRGIRDYGDLPGAFPDEGMGGLLGTARGMDPDAEIRAAVEGAPPRPLPGESPADFAVRTAYEGALPPEDEWNQPPRPRPMPRKPPPRGKRPPSGGEEGGAPPATPVPTPTNPPVAPAGGAVPAGSQPAAKPSFTPPSPDMQANANLLKKYLKSLGLSDPTIARAAPEAMETTVHYMNSHKMGVHRDPGSKPWELVRLYSPDKALSAPPRMENPDSRFDRIIVLADGTRLRMVGGRGITVAPPGYEFSPNGDVVPARATVAPDATVQATAPASRPKAVPRGTNDPEMWRKPFSDVWEEERRMASDELRKEPMLDATNDKWKKSISDAIDRGETIPPEVVADIYDPALRARIVAPVVNAPSAPNEATLRAEAESAAIADQKAAREKLATEKEAARDATTKKYDDALRATKPPKGAQMGSVDIAMRGGKESRAAHIHGGLAVNVNEAGDPSRRFSVTDRGSGLGILSANSLGKANAAAARLAPYSDVIATIPGASKSNPPEWVRLAVKGAFEFRKSFGNVSSIEDVKNIPISPDLEKAAEMFRASSGAPAKAAKPPKSPINQSGLSASMGAPNPAAVGAAASDVAARAGAGIKALADWAGGEKELPTRAGHVASMPVRSMVTPMAARVAQFGEVGAEVHEMFKDLSSVRESVQRAVAPQLSAISDFLATPGGSRARRELSRLDGWFPSEGDGVRTGDALFSEAQRLDDNDPPSGEAGRLARMLAKFTYTIGTEAKKRGAKFTETGEDFQPRESIYLRMFTPEYRDFIKNPDSREYRDYVDAVSKINGVKKAFADKAIRTLYAQLINGDKSAHPVSAIRQAAFEHQRVLPYSPAAWRKADGEIVTLMETDPARYVQRAYNAQTSRLAILATFGQTDSRGTPIGEGNDTLMNIMNEAHNTLPPGDAERFTSAFRDALAAAGNVDVDTSHGLVDPSSDAGRLVHGQGKLGEAANAAYRVYRAGMLTGAQARNITQTFHFGPAVFGYKNFVKALAQTAFSPRSSIKSAEAAGALVAEVARSNWKPYLQEGHKIRDIGEEIVSKTMRATGFRLTERLNGAIMYRLGQIAAKDARAGGFKDRAALKFLDYSQPEIDAIMSGKAPKDLVDSIPVRAARITNFQQLGGEQMSQAQNSPTFRAVVPFMTFLQQTWYRQAKLMGEYAVELESRDPRRQIQGGMGMIRSMVAPAVAGTLGSLLVAAAAGNFGDATDEGKKAKDILADLNRGDTGAALLGGGEAWTKATFDYFMGPVANLADYFDPKHPVESAATSLSLPASFLVNAMNVVMRNGRYADKDSVELAWEFAKSSAPILSRGQRLMTAATGMRDPELDAAINRFYDWRRRQPGAKAFERPSGFDGFRRHMKRAASAMKANNPLEARKAVRDALLAERDDVIAGVRSGDPTRIREPRSPAASLRGNMVLSDISPAERAKFLKDVGMADYRKLATYDQLLEYMAAAVE